MHLLVSELVLSLVAVLAITAGYAYFAQDAVPQPGGGLGHGLGVVGFLLMLSTETFYSIRKRFTSFTLFQMNTWLRIHIVTGIVGSYLVLLHSGWKFNGLAGFVALLTVMMVASGLVGRYIYTALPRSLDGVELEAAQLEDGIATAEQELQRLGVNLAATGELAVATQAPQRGWSLLLGRSWLQWRQQRRLRRALRELPVGKSPQGERLEQLLEARYRLQMQVRYLALARRVFALWHLFHVPLSIVLFTLAFIHVGAAMYYATFLK